MNKDTSLEVKARLSMFIPGLTKFLAPLEIIEASGTSIAEKKELLASASFHLDAADTALGPLTISNCTLQNALADKLSTGVLAAIPGDSSFALAASFYIPPTWSGKEWNAHLRRNLAEKPKYEIPQTAGLGLVVDIPPERKSNNSDIGLVIPTPPDLQNSDTLKSLLAAPEISASCAGGAIFLAASSQDLLLKMVSSCEHRSSSTYDWNMGSNKNEILGAQAIAIANPAQLLTSLFNQGMQEALLQAGTAEASIPEPTWKSAYREALTKSSLSALKTFKEIPPIVYAGRMPLEKSQYKQFTFSGLILMGNN